MRMNTIDAIDHIRRQIRIGHQQSGNRRSVLRDLQRRILIRYVAGWNGAHNERPINEHGVRHVLGNGNATALQELHIANARINGTRYVPDGWIETDLFDFADVPEEILHLVLGGLRSDVRDLDHFAGISSASHCGAGGGGCGSGECRKTWI